MIRLFEYRDLIHILVLRDLKVRYRRSSVGFLWTMLQPLMMLAVLHFVFAVVFQARGLENYGVFALCGILFWNFFSQSVVTSMNSLRANANILQKLPVPLAVFPIATVISGLINLAFAMVSLFVIMWATNHAITASVLFVPVSVLIAAIFTLGIGLLLAPLAVFFTDTVELVGVLFSLLYFLNPVIYPMSLVEGRRFFWVVRFSPIRSVLEVFRDPLYFHKIPPWTHLGLAAVSAVVALGVGVYVFRRSIDRVPFYL
jgi:ABC-type polysaccharide/polyol phosphate export permease